MVYEVLQSLVVFYITVLNKQVRVFSSSVFERLHIFWFWTRLRIGFLLFFLHLRKHGWVSFVLSLTSTSSILCWHSIAITCYKLLSGNEPWIFIFCTQAPLQPWLSDDFVEVVMQNRILNSPSLYPFCLWIRTFFFTGFSTKPGDGQHLCGELKDFDCLLIRGKSCKNDFYKEGRWGMLFLSWTGRETRM